ncbi:hypothetical protein THAOC_29083 [Thalassiosira oceanica]|uniref:Uncharacterized protein n=1 Tax=Thalassiosira oceanica TaxID=159749 RepID=K0RS58_THAOC|nr:hypothetical protein THAOC_29083 [Thalassiosira oceanica]|eukprot:EJK51721.1 hypothetical protein THAOC_29083 [Thalassiosira oceanica]
MNEDDVEVEVTGDDAYDDVVDVTGDGLQNASDPKSTKPNATKHGKLDHLTMANIGRMCTMEVAEGCIPEQNCPPILISPYTEAVDRGNTDDFGLEVEHRSTPRNYTARRTPPFET